MTNWSLEDPTEGLVEKLYENLNGKGDDLAKKMGFANELEALKKALSSGWVVAIGLIENDPVCAICVIPSGLTDGEYSVIGGTGTVWLICTTAIKPHPRILLEVGRAVMCAISKRYDKVEAWMDENDATAMRYAKGVGLVGTDTTQNFDGIMLRRYNYDGTSNVD
jgi:hypothetical protein